MWPFGHTHKEELRLLQEELAELRRDLKKDMEHLEYEWADWYGKFRLLHARLMKQEKKSSQDDRGATIDEAASLEQLPTRARFPNSRRGF